MTTAFPHQGVVLDEAGRPVEDAMVAVVWGTAPVPEIALLTGPDGGFRLGLPSGRFRVRAQADQRVGEIEVEGGVGGAVIVIRLQSAPS